MQYLVCMPPGPRHGACMTWCVRELVLLLAIYGPGVAYERNEGGGIESCRMMNGVSLQTNCMRELFHS